MRNVRILAAASLALPLGACVQSTEPEDADRVMFEIEYINYAWTPQFFGFIVDGSGDVFRYDRNGKPWEFQDSASWTQDRLETKYAPIKNPVASRDPAEVAAAAAKIDAAAAGSLSPRKHECADAGALTYKAYKYDPETGRSRPVLLRIEGDFAQQNTSQAAQELIAYIRSLNLIEEMLGCDP